VSERHGCSLTHAARIELKIVRGENMGAENLIPVQKSYDLCTGLYTYVNRFPRAQRSLLGRVMIEDGLQMLVQLTVANHRSDKAAALEEASGRVHGCIVRKICLGTWSTSTISVAPSLLRAALPGNSHAASRSSFPQSSGGNPLRPAAWMPAKRLRA
jgi:hypothetical protein